MVLRGTSIAIESIPTPRVRRGEVLARVLATGICGSDLHAVQFYEELGRGDPRGIVLGHEFIAEIVEVGEGVSGWSPGARVTSCPRLLTPEVPAGFTKFGFTAEIHGSYAEYMLLSADILVPVPDHVPTSLAIATEPASVGLHAVHRSHWQPGEHVAILGAGPIGLMVLLWLKSMGAEHVTVSDPSEVRRELARSVGADLVVDPRSEDLSALIAAAKGGPPPLVFDAVGAVGSINASIDLAADQGRVVVVGACITEDRFQPYTALRKELQLQFVLAYSLEEFSESMEAISSGRIAPAPLVTRSVPFASVIQEFESLANPRDCKVIVDFTR